MPAFSARELSRRVERLQGRLKELDVGLAVLSRNTDIYYYTGTMQPLYLIVPALGEPFVLARKALERISREAPQVDLETFSGSKDLSAIVERRGLSNCARIAFPLDGVAYSTVTRMQQLFGGAEAVDISWDIRTLRAVKSEAEIAIQREAAGIMAEMPELIQSNFRPGITELELSANLERHLRLKGHVGLLRCRREGIEMAGCGVCAAGANSLAGTKFDGICAGPGIAPATPYGATLDPIPKNSPVIVDFGVCYQGYHVDQTRMFSWGPPPDEGLAAYNAMVRIEEALFAVLKPGTPWEDIYDLSLDLASKAGYSEVFMGVGPEKVRFVGHGVGLELDEPPFLAPKMREPLEARMVLAIEPKVAIPELGVIGVEDTVVVLDDGAQWLTTAEKEFMVL